VASDRFEHRRAACDRSRTVGIESGRRSTVPGFGIKTDAPGGR
jgi:hypothetical protein